ncbi:uncharacterized protein LOC131889832 isoform X2 [Tigriopus californicus]|uniref:uncharacterized protein LOC131889832 isoform X2 n=1 Tax=Tigriopus californicus TaxID=6832 RepID=UPI0027D9D6AC|nr:uncharacterized protein LOC131889832 isoform X2 [Tigriopus californicus]
MGDHKLSISDGLIAFGAPLAVAGIEADIPVPTSASSDDGRQASKSNSRAPSLEEPLAEIEIEWDDEEEQRYRDWLRELQAQRRESMPLQWNEFDAEQSYRERLKQQEEDRQDEPIDWDDSREQEFRQHYIEMSWHNFRLDGQIHFLFHETLDQLVSVDQSQPPPSPRTMTA